MSCGGWRSARIAQQGSFSGSGSGMSGGRKPTSGGSVMLICPKCNSDQVRMEPIMRGSSHHDGEPLIYWRCATCRSIFSRLTAPTIILDLGETNGASV
jgi:hypothetical protein